MSEASNANQNEKAARVRRKPERETVLTPTFAAARQAASNAQSQAQSSGGALLQRQCSCGKHTIGGDDCEECQQKGETTSPDDLSQAASPDIQTTRDSTASFNLSHIPVQTHTTANGQPIQPALIVNAPGDHYEQEADRVAETVMRMPALPPPSPSTEIDSFLHPTVSRLPVISRIQTSSGNGAFQAPATVETRINQMQNGGQALPAEEQDFFEERMGYDFSHVRIHTDANAVQASRDIQARAFTVGNNIAFNQGAYRPGTDAGRRLLAHELTHVVQQQTVFQINREEATDHNAEDQTLLTRSVLSAVRDILEGADIRDVLQTVQREIELPDIYYRALWDFYKGKQGKEYDNEGQETEAVGQRRRFWVRAGRTRINPLVEFATTHISDLQSTLQTIRSQVQELYHLAFQETTGTPDEQSDDGTTSGGTIIGNFYIYISPPSAVTAQVANVQNYLQRMPSQHSSVLDPIFIVERLPGGRASGGGYWRPGEVSRAWLGRQARTGVPDADIQDFVLSGGYGVIAITRTAILKNIAHFTVVHEAAHSVDNYLSIVPPNASLEDFAGVRYPRPRVGEYAAEAYARYVINPDRVCRSENIPEGESMRSCSQRIIAKLMEAPAFSE